MNNKETVIENFDCPVLSGIANVKITYLSLRSDVNSGYQIIHAASILL